MSCLRVVMLCKFCQKASKIKWFKETAVIFCMRFSDWSRLGWIRLLPQVIQDPDFFHFIALSSCGALHLSDEAGLSKSLGVESEDVQRKKLPLPSHCS